MTNNFQYQVGGSLPIDNTAYVDRQCDLELLERLRDSEYCFVFNSRQMGKSSLRVRTMQRLQQEGFVCAVIDPQTRGTTLREDQWYAGTIKRLIGDLYLEQAIDFPKWWKELDAQSISVVERFDYFIEQTMLPNIPNKITIFIEEVDNLLSLKFDTDGFFILIRSLYERRAEKPEYQRLSFAFLGVATPSDLIRGKGNSAFNIGYALEMSGFTLLEAAPLAQGLDGKFNNPQAVLAAILHWTGGQPFLTQKLLNLVASETERDLSPENFVRIVVSERVIDNWEAQDIPPHLKTIRDRILQSDEKGRGRLLGLYQQVLDCDGIAADESYDQMLLRLTGLVIKRDSRLVVYNPIYGAVFNQAWVSHSLRNLRPEFYASALTAWQESNEQNEEFLLRGRALEDAEAWAKGKRLSAEDEHFLQSSREAEKHIIACSLESEKLMRETIERANLILAYKEAQQKALINAIPDLMMRINSEGVFLEFLASPTFRVLGNESSMVGKHMSDVLPLEIAQERMMYIQLSLETRSIQIYEQSLFFDGICQTEEVRMVPYGKDEVLALVRDISEIKISEMQAKLYLAQQKLIESLSQQILSLNNIEEIIDTTIFEIRKILTLDRVFIFKILENGAGIVISESVSQKWEAIINKIYRASIFLEEWHHNYLQGQAYVINNVYTEAISPHLLEFLNTTQVKSKIALPIIQDKKLWGLLIAHQCDYARQWQSSEKNLLQLISIHLAIAIQQEILYRRM